MKTLVKIVVTLLLAAGVVVGASVAASAKTVHDDGMAVSTR